MNYLKSLRWVTLSLLMVSCSSDKASAENMSTLDVSPRGLLFPADQASDTFNIYSKGGWVIDKPADWIELTGLSGSGNAEIGITVRENPGEQERNTTLRIALTDGSSASGTHITQAGRNSTFVFQPQSKTANPEGEFFTLLVSAGSTWEVTIPEQATSWISEQSRNDESVTFAIGINRDKARKTTVNFKAGKISANYEISQEKFTSATDKMPWRNVALTMPASWYGTNEALDIAENVLLYQREIGGWPKNIDIHHFLSDAEKQQVLNDKKKPDAIFDNDATTLEMKFLAKVYALKEDLRLRESFNGGLGFILKAQYGSEYKGEGGWPMYYPLRGKAYYDRITFNDNAMSNLLGVLKDIYTEIPLYEKIVSHETAAKAKTSYEKGIRCILGCQIVKKGEKTVWCAQHDENTLAPAYGRPFEHPSFSGCETVGVLRTLMAVDNPSQDVKDAVIAAMKWLDQHRIKDKQMANIVDKNGNPDRIIVDTPGKDMWARFYHLDLEVPIFGDYVTPPVILFDLFDVPQARRAGYQFYGNWPDVLFQKEYPAWKTKNGIL